MLMSKKTHSATFLSFRHRAGNGGFTLVEMLVVISIIAILASLLAPSLQSAMQSAKSIACINSQKQISTALMSYSGDYAGWSPGSLVYNLGVGGALAWSTMLTDVKRWNPDAYAGVYVDNTEIFFCPSGKLPAYPFGVTPNNTTWVTYGIVQNGGGTSTWQGELWSKWTSVISCGSGKYDRWMRLSSCPKPSKMALLADTIRNNVATPSQYFWWEPHGAYQQTRVQTRHLNSCNFAFVDGHAESLNENNLLEDMDITYFCTQNFENIDL